MLELGSRPRQPFTKVLLYKLSWDGFPFTNVLLYKLSWYAFVQHEQPPSLSGLGTLTLTSMAITRLACESSVVSRRLVDLLWF